MSRMTLGGGRALMARRSTASSVVAPFVFVSGFTSSNATNVRVATTVEVPVGSRILVCSYILGSFTSGFHDNNGVLTYAASYAAGSEIDNVTTINDRLRFWEGVLTSTMPVGALIGPTVGASTTGGIIGLAFPPGTAAVDNTGTGMGAGWSTNQASVGPITHAPTTTPADCLQILALRTHSDTEGGIPAAWGAKLANAKNGSGHGISLYRQHVAAGASPVDFQATFTAIQGGHIRRTLAR